MKETSESCIVFDNLVQADSDVVGKSQPVRAKEKTSGKMYTQAEASGELYRPADLNEVGVRAQEAAKRFKSMFKNKDKG